MLISQDHFLKCPWVSFLSDFILSHFQLPFFPLSPCQVVRMTLISETCFSFPDSDRAPTCHWETIPQKPINSFKSKIDLNVGHWGLSLCLNVIAWRRARYTHRKKELVLMWVWKPRSDPPLQICSLFAELHRAVGKIKHKCYVQWPKAVPGVAVTSGGGQRLAKAKAESRNPPLGVEAREGPGWWQWELCPPAPFHKPCPAA